MQENRSIDMYSICKRKLRRPLFSCEFLLPLFSSGERNEAEV